MDLEGFHNSVKTGDVDAVRQAVTDDPLLVQARSANGQSAYLLAHYYRQPAIIDLLSGMDLNLDLFERCAGGDLAGVQRELNTDEGGLETHSPDGWTPLHLAAFFGRHAIAGALIDRGASVNVRSTNHMANTPLHAAAAAGQIAMVKLLLDNGAVIDARQHGGWTALHAAAQSGNRQLAESLLSRGAKFDIPADNGQTALDLALLGGKAEIVELLERQW